MPEESDGFTVCIGLRKVIPDAVYVRAIEDAVTRVHRITFDATELLALHVTRCLESNIPLPKIDANYIKMVMMEVSSGKGQRAKVDDELAKTRTLCMDTLVPVCRQRLDQLLMAQSISLAASVQTNVWFHFPRRVFRYVRSLRRQELLDAGGSTKEVKLRLMKMVAAICGPCAVDEASEDGTWINEQRRLLGCDVFTSKSTEMNGKKHTNAMLRATWIINKELEARGLKCTSCMPIRRQFRPAFCSIDTNALCTILHLPIPKGKGSFGKCKGDIWNGVLSLDKGTVKGVARRVFAGSMRTDGVSARLLFDNPPKRREKRSRSGSERPSVLPTRGIHSIDQLKHLSRTYQVVGADPGKRELLVCVDADAPSSPSVRYTAAQRRTETHVAIHNQQEALRRPDALSQNIAALSEHNSRSSSLATQCEYFHRRREFLDEAIRHYSDAWHRKRRWERHVRSQRSLTDFVRRIRSLQREDDVPIALAYGAWGAVAGRPGAPCNKGAPPCIGRGLRKTLSRHFLVLPTPEQYTSKTCSLCGSLCGPCEEVDNHHRTRLLDEATSDDEVRRAQRFSVRGLRHCHNAQCAAHLNRDHNAAVNIQRRCEALLSDAPVSTPSDAVDNALESLRIWMEHGA